MSRGLGFEQRRILQALAQAGGEVSGGRLKELTWGRREQHIRGSRPVTLDYWRKAKDGEPAANHHQSFRRALLSLEARGLIEARTEVSRYRKKPRVLYRLTADGVKCSVSVVNTYGLAERG